LRGGVSGEGDEGKLNQTPVVPQSFKPTFPPVGARGRSTKISRREFNNASRFDGGPDRGQSVNCNHDSRTDPIGGVAEYGFYGMPGRRSTSSYSRKSASQRYACAPRRCCDSIHSALKYRRRLRRRPDTRSDQRPRRAHGPATEPVRHIVAEGGPTGVSP
jgi:hypothetical protein